MRRRHHPHPQRRRWAALAAVVAAAPALAACGGEVSEKGASDGSQSSTELRVALGGEPDDGFDPTLGWGRYGSPLFQSTLLRRDADLDLVPELATDYRVSADGLTWTVNLRDDAVFTDGQAVTAADVAYTFNTAAEQGGLTDVTALREAEVVDTDTVALHLDEPRSAFVNRLVSLGIVPEHAHGEGYAADPVGSGPFRLVSWQRGQQLVVERNDDYYGELPQFERITFVFTDEDATIAMARSGEVELASVASAMATTPVDGMRIEAVPSVDNRGIAFPTVADTGRRSPAGAPIGNDVTADVAVRRAINVAVDRDALVDGVLEGYGAPAAGPADHLPWANPEAVIEDADPAAAAAILQEAGWVDADGDGVREKDGVPARFTLLYPADDSLRQGLALSVVDMVAEAGIAIRAEGASWEEIDQRLHSDAVMFGWGSHDPTEMYNLYHSSKAGVELYNPGYYADGAVDAHLDAAMRATDQEQATEHWRAAQLDESGHGFTAPDDAAWAWLVNLEHTYYVDECLDLGELQVEPHGHGWPITAGISQWRRTC